MLIKRKKHLLAVVFLVCLLILIHSSVFNCFFEREKSSIKQKKQKNLVLERKQSIPERITKVTRKPAGVPARAFENAVQVGLSTTSLYPQAISRLKKKSFKRY